MSVDRMSLDRMPVYRMQFYRMSVYRMPVDRMPACSYFFLQVGTSTWLEYFLHLTDISKETLTYLSGNDKLLVSRLSNFSSSSLIKVSQVSISAILYEQLFCTNVFLRSFYVLKIWACNYSAKEFFAKAAHKMLVKLSPGRSSLEWSFYPSFNLIKLFLA